MGTCVRVLLEVEKAMTDKHTPAELIVNAHKENKQLQEQVELLQKTLQEMTQRAKLESRYDDVVKAAFYDLIQQAEEALK